MSAPECPDCGADLAGAVVVHAETCPLVRSAGSQAEWLTQNPGDRFLRPSTVAERELLGVGPLVEVARPVAGELG